MMTTTLTMYMLPILPLFPIFALTLNQKSFMMSLLCLEAIILTLVMLTMIFMSTPTMNEPFMCMILLVFGACEAGIGLAIMVTILRSQGNEKMNHLTMSKC